MPINNNTVYVTSSAGGPLVGFILNILRGYNMTRKDIETEDEQIRTYHRFIESFKYGKNKTILDLMIYLKKKIN